MNNLKLKKLVCVVSLFALMPTVTYAAEIFSVDEQLKHGQEMVDSQNIKEKRKLDLEIAILNNEIKNIDGSNQKTIDDAVKKSTALMEKKYLLEIQMLKKQVATLNKKNGELMGQSGAVSQQVEDIFYTGMIQVGDSKKAEVFASGTKSMYSVGESIVPGVVISSIEPTKLVVRSGKGFRTYARQSTAQIADKLYEAAVDKARSGGDRSSARDIVGNSAMKLPNDFNIGDEERD